MLVYIQVLIFIAPVSESSSHHFSGMANVVKDGLCIPYLYNDAYLSPTIHTWCSS